VSKLIGVPPGQFILIVVLSQLVESYSHANIRMSFGKIGERLLVSPKFHRYHHSIEYDESTAGPAHGHNFAVLFPIWDILFGTARYNTGYAKTGIHDQEPAGGVEITAAVSLPSSGWACGECLDQRPQVLKEARNKSLRTRRGLNEKKLAAWLNNAASFFMRE